MSPGRRPRKGTLPPSQSTPPTAISTTPRITTIRPKSAIVPVLLERELERAVSPAVAEMSIGGGRRAPAARGPHDEPDLEKVRLDQLGERLGVVVDGRSDRLEPHG